MTAALVSMYVCALFATGLVALAPVLSPVRAVVRVRPCSGR